MLSSLQSNGLTDVMLQALLIKDVCGGVDCWGDGFENMGVGVML